jgi:hypothetical protein
VAFLIFLIFGTPNRNVFQNSHKTVILRACDLFDFSYFSHTQPERFSKLPQDRHPERSASRMYRMTAGLQRVVEGPRGCSLADALHSFPATKTMGEIKKVTTSERSASPIYRGTPRWMTILSNFLWN